MIDGASKERRERQINLVVVNGTSFQSSDGNVDGCGDLARDSIRPMGLIDDTGLEQRPSKDRDIL
jgi:hypothetical protein